jgi:hypothetical protein
VALSDALLKAIRGQQDDSSVDSMVADLSGALPSPQPVHEASADELVADFKPAEAEGGGAETPSAPLKEDDSPGWVKGLRSLFGSEHPGIDPESKAYGSGGKTNDPSGTPTAVLAAAINGPVGHYVKAGANLADEVGPAINGLSAPEPNSGIFNDAIAPYRDWDARAQREAPIPYAAVDMVSSALDPINKLALGAKAIKATSAGKGALRMAANMGEQGALAMGDSAVREFGDTGNVEKPDWISGVLGTALSAPQSLVSATAARSAAKQGTPEARLLRGQEADREFLRSAGYPDGMIDELAAQPEKYENVLSEVKHLAAQHGEGKGILGAAYKVPQMAAMVEKARAEAELGKRAAAAALTEGGATVNPMDVANKIREDVRARSPGAQSGAPLSSDYVGGADAVAKRYADMPRPVRGEIAGSNVGPSSEPDAVGALAAQAEPTIDVTDDMLSSAGPPPAPVPEYAPVADADLIPVRPSARAQPQPQPPAAPSDPGLAQAPQPPAPAWRDRPDIQAIQAATQLADSSGMQGMGALPPPPLPAGPQDAIGALAAAGQAPSWRDRPELAPFTAAPPRPATPLPSPEGPSWQDRVAAMQPGDPVPGANSGMQGLGVAQQPVPRYSPQLPPPPLPAGPQGPPDAIGALAGQAPSPPLHDSVGAFGSMMGQGPNFDPGPAPVPFDHYIDELQKAGQVIKPEFAKPEDAFARERYAGIDHAMDLGADQANPELAQQWADSKAHEGVLNLIGEQAGAAANSRTRAPLFNLPGNAMSGILGSLGGATGVGLGLGTLGTAGLGAAGLGLGMAAGQWIQPRQHSLRANWLSHDTADAMDRLSGIGQKPAGTTAASLHDALNGPSPFSLPQPALLQEQEPTSQNDQTAYPPGQTLGRATTAAMKANPDAFMQYSDDFNKARNDDSRAAVVERLARTDPNFGSILSLIGQHQEEIT